MSREEIEKMKDGLQKQLFNTMQANECGLSNNDFKEDIEILNGAIQYIDQLEQENKALKGGLDRNKKSCFYEDGHTEKCLGYSNANDDEPCEYCKSCEALSIKGDD